MRSPRDATTADTTAEVDQQVDQIVAWADYALRTSRPPTLSRSRGGEGTHLTGFTLRRRAMASVTSSWSIRVGTPIDEARSPLTRRNTAEVPSVTVDDREAVGIARLDAEGDLLAVR